MEKLPVEIIEHILKNPCLSIKDIVNFASTCSKFKEIVTSNTTIWKDKYFQRWPKTDVEIDVENWHNECISRKNFEDKAFELLSIMSSNFYMYDLKHINSNQLQFVNEFIDSYKYGYYYLRDYLLSINYLPLSQSLTNKYYGTILLKFINKRHYNQVWNSLLELDSKEQTPEKGAIFVSHWCQDNEGGITKSIAADLDNIAELVKSYISKTFKDHPLNKISEDTFLTWKRNNIARNMFGPHLCEQILGSINYILFDCLKYSVTYEVHNMDRRKCAIDCAITDRRPTPIIFAVIYESVARRLGVRVEILEFLDHTLLRWKENYSEEDSAYHYINMSNTKDVFIRKRSCPRRCTGNLVIAPCNMQQIALRAACDIYPRDRRENHLSVRDVLELLLVIKPFSLEWYQQLCWCYMHDEMNVQELISKLLTLRGQMPEAEWIRFQPLLHSLESYQKNWEFEHNVSYKAPFSRFRNSTLEFAVGMIVRDKTLNTIGVIYGWGAIAKAPWSGIHSTQPFYKVLVEDGSSSYVSQENLQILHSPPFVSHPFIGRFFEEYCTTYYKPNKQLQFEYPDDMEALQNILKKAREGGIRNIAM